MRVALAQKKRFVDNFSRALFSKNLISKLKNRENKKVAITERLTGASSKNHM